MSKVVRLSDSTLEPLEEFRAIIINNLEEEIKDSITSKTLKEFLKKDIYKYRSDDNYVISLALLSAIQYYKET